MTKNVIIKKLKFILIKLFKKILKKIIILYSLKNNKIKITPINSVLNPLTNSLSPSERSIGIRFISLKIIIINNQKNIKK